MASPLMRTGKPARSVYAPGVLAGGGGRSLPHIHVSGVRAHPHSVQAFVHLTYGHHGANFVAGRPSFCCPVQC
jgi:hypothetical protein